MWEDWWLGGEWSLGGHLERFQNMKFKSQLYTILLQASPKPPSSLSQNLATGLKFLFS